jgi:1,6-anhydro-N-acetylmuramate kinase
VRVAGVMSGTSLDGIDVAIVEIRGRRIETIGYQSTAYPEAVRAAILQLSGGGGVANISGADPPVVLFPSTSISVTQAPSPP